MRNKAIGLIIVGALGLTATDARAEPVMIGSATVNFGAGGGMTLTHGRFIFAVTPISSVQLFSEHLLSAADIGRTFVATGANDDDFPEVARQLTNGVGNYVETQFATRGGTAANGYVAEGDLFHLSTPDFRGSTISSFAFRLDEFGPRPYPPGSPTLYLFMGGELMVFGSGGSDPLPTPEPATMVLLAAGLAGLVVRHRMQNGVAEKGV
jgi:PEP-CTERM motif-containing protein